MEVRRKLTKMYPTPQNIIGIQGIFLYANQVTNNWFTTGIVFSIFVLVFLYNLKKMKKVGISLATASFASFFFAGLLWAGGVLPAKIVIILLSLTSLFSLMAFIED